MTINEQVADQFEAILRAWRGIPAGSDEEIERDLRDVVVRLANVAEVHYANPPGLIHVLAQMVQVGFEPGGKTVRVRLEISQTRERIEALAMMAPVVTLRGYEAPEEGEETVPAADPQMTIDEIKSDGSEVVGGGAEYWDPTGSYVLSARLAVGEPGRE